MAKALTTPTMAIIPTLPIPLSSFFGVIEEELVCNPVSDL
jgi:hypothetical protein